MERMMIGWIMMERITIGRVVPDSVGGVIHGYKSAVTKRINTIRQSPGHTIWQRNYYEDIIRNDESLEKIRDYIHNNPLN